MAQKGQILCGKCKQDLPKNGDYAYCKACDSGLHFEDCSGLKSKSWKSKGKADQDAWICPQCRSRRKASASNENEPNLEEETLNEKEVSGPGIYKTLLEKVDSLLLMKMDVASIDKSMAMLAAQYDKLLEEVGSLREENKKLKKEVEILKKHADDSREVHERQEVYIADLDQYGRRCNLEIHGLKVDGDPSQENVEVVIKNIASKINITYNKAKIHRAHRLQQRKDGKPSTLLVQFYSGEERNAWLQAGRSARISGIYFNENLCQHYRTLLRDTRVKARALGYEHVWWQGGKILVRKREGERKVLVIKSRNDLGKLIGN